MNGLNDEKLKSLLQKYQPQPPPAEPGEFNKLLSKLELVRPKIRPLWFSVGSAIAASLLTVWIFVQYSAEAPVLTTQYEEVAEDGDLMLEEWPTLDVGEDYLQLASD